jgi:hypothetical protein
MEATLLQLPAELRNRIYEYALTDPSSTGLRFKAFLIVNVTICKPLLLGTNGEQFNVLKHVCRQLRAETDGLDLAYNVALIEQVRRDDWAPTKRLFAMIGPNVMSLKPLNFLLVEHPEGKREPWSDTLALADWCALHSNIQIGFVLTEFCCFDNSYPERWRFRKNFSTWTSEDRDNASQRMSKFLGRGVWYTLAFRGAARWPTSEWKRLGFDVAIEVEREKLLDAVEVARERWDIDKHGAVRNLRFEPVGGEVDELMIRCLTCLANKAEVSDEIMKEWEGIVRMWCKDGV